MESSSMTLKLRFSKIFRSSFCSRKSINTSTVPSIFEYHTDLTTTTTSTMKSPNEPFISSKVVKPPHRTTSCPSMMCMRRQSCFPNIHDHHSLPRRRKTSSKQPNSDYPPRCPPSYPLMYYYLESQAAETDIAASHDRDKEKKKKQKQKQKQKTWRRSIMQRTAMMMGEGTYYSRGVHLKKTKKSYAFFHNPLSSSNDDDWFSSDDEREDHERITTRDDAPFSSLSSKSLSFSSNSNSHFPVSDSDSNPAPTQMPSRRRADGNNVRETFAVVKSSADPYSDFRESMLEMIVERQMFGAQDLEKLLECFLYLNSHHHHNLIVDVFAEILEALFPSKR